MKRYSVIFTQNFEYEVEANDECEAEELAYKEFEADMRYPIAQTWYDECDIDCLEDLDDDEDDEDDLIYEECNEN